MPSCSIGCAPWPVGCAASVSARATASSSTCRWCPRPSSRCSRARASAPSTPSSSAASPRRSSRRASTTPRRRSCSRRRAASSRAASCPTSRSSTRRSGARRTSPSTASCSSASSSSAELGERDIDWARLRVRRRRARGQRVRHGRRDRPALHPLHVRHDGEAQGHLPRQRRLRRRAALVDGQHLRRRAGRDDVHRERRRLGRRPLLHRLRAAADRGDDGALRGQAGRHPGRRRVLARHRGVRRRLRSSPRRPPSGRSRRTTRRRPRLADHDLSRFRALFLAGERLDPDTYEWASAALGKPVIDNWWQTETGWPIASNPKGIGLLPIKAGSPTVAGSRL